MLPFRFNKSRKHAFTPTLKHEISIDRRGHSFSVLGRVDEMRRDKQFCDFIIKVGSEEIHAHRNILAGGSDYFRAMFSHDTKERKSGVVEMLGVDAGCTIICIDHMYGGKAHVPDGKYEEMMHVADLMLLHTLRDAIASLLEEELDSKTFFVARKIASMYECKKLEKKCKKFAEESFHAISNEVEFGGLEKSFIKKIVRSKNGKISEAEKLDALVKWIKFDGDRKNIFMEMLKSVDLCQVSTGFRRHLIESEPLVNKDSECLLYLSLSFRDTMGVESEAFVPSALSPGLKGSILVFDMNSGHLQRFNPRDNSWTKMHEMNDDMKRNFFSAVTLDGQVYVLMQNKSVYCLKFTDEKSNWEKMADMIEEHGKFPPVVVLSGYIYVVAACWHEQCSSKVERYDPIFEQWTKVEDKPQPSTGSEIIAIQGNIYSVSGYCGNQFVKCVEKFDPISSKWEIVGSVNYGRLLTATTEVNEQIFVLGGNRDSTPMSTVECYDIRTNRCTILKPMTLPRYRCRGFAVDGTVFAVGGYATKNSIEKYDATKSEWEMVKLPEGLNLEIKESVQI